MSLIGSSSGGELHIDSPSGSIKIVQMMRQAVVTGSRPQWDTGWYLDQLKGAREAVKDPKKASVEFVIRFKGEPKENTTWALTMLQAAEDGVRRWGRFGRPERETAIPVGPNGYTLDSRCGQTGRFGQYKILPGKRNG